MIELQPAGFSPVKFGGARRISVIASLLLAAFAAGASAQTTPSNNNSPTSAAAQPIQSADALTALVKDHESRVAALKIFGEQKDRSVVPAILELMLFSRYGAVEKLDDTEIQILRTLTGRSIPGSDWREWMEWAWNEKGLKTHAGFSQLQRHLFAKVRPPLGAVLDPAAPARIDRTEIIPRPGFMQRTAQAMNNPTIIPNESRDGDYIDSVDPVLGVELNGERRAYPSRVLLNREIINDTLGGKRIVVTYSTLTGAVNVYEVETRAGQKTPNFAFTGLLYRADALISDDQTSSLWSSRLGEPILGSLCSDDKRAQPPIKLKPIHATFTIWDLWRNVYPDTTTLALEKGREQEYRDPNPYGKYAQLAATELPLFRRDERLPMNLPVVGIAFNGEAVAYPYLQMDQEPMIKDRVGGERVVVLCDLTRDEFRVYATGRRRMEATNSPIFVEEYQSTTHWRIGESNLGFGIENGPRLTLQRIKEQVVPWYAWSMWHPDTRIFSQDAGPYEHQVSVTKDNKIVMTSGRIEP